MLQYIYTLCIRLELRGFRPGGRAYGGQRGLRYTRTHSHAQE